MDDETDEEVFDRLREEKGSMLKITVELVSAVTGRTTELGRMYVANDGKGTVEMGHYDASVCRKGTTAVPKPINPGGAKATRVGRVENYPRKKYNMWRLILRCLKSAFPEEG